MTNPYGLYELEESDFFGEMSHLTIHTMFELKSPLQTRFYSSLKDRFLMLKKENETCSLQIGMTTKSRSKCMMEEKKMNEVFYTVILTSIGVLFLLVLVVAGINHYIRRKGIKNHLHVEKSFFLMQSSAPQPVFDRNGTAPSKPAISDSLREKKPFSGQHEGICERLEDVYKNKGSYPYRLIIDTSCVGIDHIQLEKLWMYCADKRIRLSFAKDSLAEIELLALSKDEGIRTNAAFITSRRQKYHYEVFNFGMRRLYSFTQEKRLMASLPREESCMLFGNIFRFNEFVKYVKAEKPDNLSLICLDKHFPNLYSEHFATLSSLQSNIFCASSVNAYSVCLPQLAKLKIATTHIREQIPYRKFNSIFVGDIPYAFQDFSPLESNDNDNFHGGESSIYCFNKEETGYILKLYHYYPSAEKVKKLLKLIEKGQQYPSLTETNAFPLELVYSADKRCIGFVMKHFQDTGSVYAYLKYLQNRYTPSTAALNKTIVKKIAAKYLELECAGVYLPDFSSKNILTDSDANIYFVDIDSAQADNYLSDASRESLLHPDFDNHSDFTAYYREPHHFEFGFYLLALNLILGYPDALKTNDESWCDCRSFELFDYASSDERYQNNGYAKRWQALFKEGSLPRIVFSNEVHTRACYSLGDYYLAG